MAIIHKATITPSKADILGDWLPRQPWYHGTGQLRPVANYRFDDPAGEVGLEGTIVEAGAGVLFHVPCSYRAEPLAEADEYLMGTAEHSVLGSRYFYDAAGDPVWAAALAGAIAGGGVQADEVMPDGTVRVPSMRVRGSGRSDSRSVEVDAVSTRDGDGITVIGTGGFELILVRSIGADVPTDHVLTGEWDGQDAILAGLSAAPR